MKMSELLDWIKTNYKQGIPISSLKNKLIEKNYSEEQINNEFYSFFYEFARENKKKINRINILKKELISLNLKEKELDSLMNIVISKKDKKKINYKYFLFIIIIIFLIVKLYPFFNNLFLETKISAKGYDITFCNKVYEFEEIQYNFEHISEDLKLFNIDKDDMPKFPETLYSRCILQKAELYEDQLLCKIITMDDQKDVCYNNLAMIKEDHNICDNINERTTRNKCIFNIAYKNANPELCNNLKEMSAKEERDMRNMLKENQIPTPQGSFVKEEVDNCIMRINHRVTLLEEGESHCNSKYVWPDKETCLLELAELKKDKNLCGDLNSNANEIILRNKINGEKFCYEYLMKEDSNFICENEDFFCFSEFAIVNNDLSICDSLKNSEITLRGEPKINCYNLFLSEKLPIVASTRDDNLCYIYLNYTQDLSNIPPYISTMIKDKFNLCKVLANEDYKKCFELNKFDKQTCFLQFAKIK